MYCGLEDKCQIDKFPLPNFLLKIMGDVAAEWVKSNGLHRLVITYLKKIKIGFLNNWGDVKKKLTGLLWWLLAVSLLFVWTKTHRHIDSVFWRCCFFKCHHESFASLFPWPARSSASGPVYLTVWIVSSGRVAWCLQIFSEVVFNKGCSLAGEMKRKLRNLIACTKSYIYFLCIFWQLVPSLFPLW